eukprot:m.32382 g.32382  ORF g.32382 m.32382 type:complete len:60 (-) comp12146_c2_seq19:701-880(-)
MTDSEYWIQLANKLDVRLAEALQTGLSFSFNAEGVPSLQTSMVYPMLYNSAILTQQLRR